MKGSATDHNGCWIVVVVVFVLQPKDLLIPGCRRLLLEEACEKERVLISGAG